MFSFIFLGYSLAHLFVAISLIRLLGRGYVPGAIFVTFVGLALVFDNAMIAFGSRIGAGEFLETLSYPRFAMHAAFTPFLMLVGWLIAKAAGLSWTKNKLIYGGLWILMLSMSGYGIYVDLFGGLELQTACLGDTLRYTSSTPPPQFCYPDQVSLAGHGPPIPSIVTCVVCLIVGFSLWRANGWPWLLASATFMFLAAGAPQANFGPTFGNLGEVVLQAGFAATLWRFAPKRKRLPA